MGSDWLKRDWKVSDLSAADLREEVEHALEGACSLLRSREESLVAEGYGDRTREREATAAVFALFGAVNALAERVARLEHRAGG